jgi:hypothetical protein
VFIQSIRLERNGGRGGFPPLQRSVWSQNKQGVC